MSSAPHQFSGDDLKKVEEKRASFVSEPHDPKATYKKVCPLCSKPNTVTVDFCTGCSFELVDKDVQKVSSNVFLDIINGVVGQELIRYRSDDYLVFNDKFGVAENHIQAIPTIVVDDISCLTEKHIPILEEMYRLGLKEFKSRNIPIFDGKNIEDLIFAGYNHPVSVKHLHLHMALPPFHHLKVFVYPRWHPHHKVLNDLRTHGKVLLYSDDPNDDEGNQADSRVVKLHKEYSSL
uniref:UBA/TSN domain containing protein n=1 Tax=Hirondellea gigas TaxID=1518452 RepID=A0A6A7FWZ1_9CRUS